MATIISRFGKQKQATAGIDRDLSVISIQN
jgi:hypothetical protein